ncbi:MAG: RNA methyltransferase [Bacilli bacterium]
MIIVSTENEKIKNIKKLNQKKYRDLENLFLIEGDHLVLEAIKNNRLETLIILEGEENPFEIEPLIVSKKVMKYISELDSPKKIMGVARKQISSAIGTKVIALDGVQDPGNLGTIIRSSVAFNFDTILISKNTVDPYNQKVVRASQGLIFSTNIIETDLKDTLTKLEGHKIYSTRVNGGTDINNIKKEDKLVVVMGNEGTGVTSEIEEISNDFLYINMNPLCESLNVAVASSIIMHTLGGIK